MHSIVHLILNRLEEPPGRFCILVIIKRCCVQIRYFLIELALRQTNFPNLLQLPLEVFIREHVTLFQAFHIHCPALNSVVLDDLPRPLAELHSTLIVHLEAHGNNHLQIIMRQFPIDLTSALGLNYPEFPDSCLLGQFAVRIDFFDMLVDRAHIHIIQCRHHLLRQPDVFILIAHFIACIALTRRSHKSQVLRSRTMNQFGG